MYARTRLILLLAAVAVLLATSAPSARAADPLASTGAMSVLGPMDLVRVVQRAKGKPIVFSFWASWCAPCRAEIPELNALRAAFGPDELVLAGLSVDEDPAAYSKFVAETDIDYPVRRVTDAVAKLYRIGTIPRLIVYNTRGEMVVSHEGVAESGDLIELTRKLIDEGTD